MATTIQPIELPKKARALDTSSSLQPIGGNLLAGSGFEGITQAESTSGAIWNTGVGWTIGSGVASCDGSQSASSNMYNTDDDLLDPENKFWEITFTVTAYTAGNIRAQIGGYGPLTEERDATGTYTEIVGPIHSSSQNRLYLKASSDFIGSVDNVIVKEAMNFNNNNHGQIYSGRGLEFDGVGDSLSLPTELTLVDFSAETTQASRAWTVAAWVNIDSASTGYIQNVIGATANSISYLGIDTNEKLTIYDQTGSAYRTSDTALNANTWYRALWVFNGVDEIAFYLNGVADGTSAMGTTGDDADLAVNYIGARRPGNSTASISRYFTGKMSDLQLWQGAFTAEDASYDYLNPESLALNNGGTALTESNLKLWYPMQDGHRGQQSYILDGANSGLGDEMITDSDFALTGTQAENTTGTYWTTGTGWTISGGNLNASSPGGTVATSQSMDGLTAGKTYKVSFEVSEITSGYFRLYAYAGASGTFTNIFSSPELESGTYETTFEFGGTDKTFRIYGAPNSASALTVGSISNISVKAINDKNHATTVFYGDEMVENGDFATDSDWTKNGWTINEEASNDGVNTGNLNQDIGLQQNKRYLIEVTISNYNSGTLQVRLGTGTNVDVGSSEDTFSLTLISTTTNSLLRFYPKAGDLFNGSIDNVSVKEVGVASGWTDADQQLHIPQTALQSYNELAWGNDGGLNYVIVTPDPNFGKADFSISWAFYTGNAGGSEKVFTMRTPLSVRRINNTVLQIYADDGTGNSTGYAAVTPSIIQSGKWYHVIENWNYSGGDWADVSVYINGEKMSESSDLSDLNGTIDFNYTGDHHFGRFSGTGCLTGAITEIAYWKGINFTDAEAVELYNDGKILDAKLHSRNDASILLNYWRNNGLSQWKDLVGTDHSSANTFTETILIPQGVDSSRDNQGFIMNKQKDTSCLNLPYGTESGLAPGYVEVNNSDTLKITGAYTLAAWVKLTLIGDDYQRIVALETGSNGTNGYGMYVHTNGKVYNTSNNDSQVSASAQVTADTWTYIAVTADGTDKKIYVNGEQTDTATNSNDGAATTSNLFIGKSGGLANRQANGVIDGVLVYDSALDSTEITRNYNATKGSHRN